MAAPLSNIRDELRRVIASDNFLLFVGAGVGVEAGLGTWADALNEIATAIEGREPAAAGFMRQLVGQNRYLEAADAFELALPSTSDRYEILTTVFGKTPIVNHRLKRLTQTCGRGIVTTNFDRSLIDAAQAAEVNLVQFGEGPDDLASARLLRDRIFVRLHGRVEVPAGIVLSSRAYDRLETNDAYRGFVFSLLSDSSLVFFGFSFSDPFLKATLRLWRKMTRGRMARTSFALLPAAPDAELQTLLQELNIHIVQYNDADEHREGWQLLLGPDAPHPVVTDHPALVEGRLRSTFAALLTHLRLRADGDLRNAVIAAAAIAEVAARPGIELEETVCRTADALAMATSDHSIVKNAVGESIRAGRLVLSDSKLMISAASDDDVASPLGSLVDGILARAAARYGLTASGSTVTRAALGELLVRVMIADGLAVAHSIIAGSARQRTHIGQLISESIETFPIAQKAEIQSLVPAVLSLFDLPEADQEQALDSLASTALVLCTSAIDPTIPALSEKWTSAKLYLDASVVLPWLCTGHPLEATYGTIVGGFGPAAIRVPEFYLNELVSHRELALREYREAGLENPDTFRRYVQYFRLDGINAYLGGFGGAIRRGFTGSFPDYLDQVVPFVTEGQAGDFLAGRGITVEDPTQRHSIRDVNLPVIAGLLADQLERHRKPRNRIRIEHDAKMVGVLVSARAGTSRDTLFVTADRTLVSAVASSRYSGVLYSILLPYQAAGLAHAVGKTKGVIPGIARTLWSIRREDTEQIREFYTDRVLREYEPALLKPLNDIVEEVVAEAEAARRRTGHALGELDTDVSLRVAKFSALDRYEARFHERMLKAKKDLGLK